MSVSVLMIQMNACCFFGILFPPAAHGQAVYELFLVIPLQYQYAIHSKFEQVACFAGSLTLDSWNVKALI